MSLRDQFPDAAAAVDALRQMLGADLVNDALRRGMALQREHAARVQRDGADAADAWLGQQQGGEPVMSVRQGDVAVGLMPGCNPAPLRWRARR